MLTMERDLRLRERFADVGLFSANMFLRPCAMCGDWNFLCEVYGEEPSSSDRSVAGSQGIVRFRVAVGSGMKM